MKKTIAAALAAILTFSAMPVSAAYQSRDEIAFALRGMETENCGYLAEENTVYISPAAAKNGTKLRMGMFIEAEYADLVILEAELCTSDPALTFIPESYCNPTDIYTSEKASYVTEAGQEFSTQLKPYCFGFINNSNIYAHASAGVYGNFNDANDHFKVIWYSSISRKAQFFGSRSDEYSFVELEVNIAAGTKAGEYSVSFLSNINAENPYGESFLSSDDPEKVYVDFLPTLKDLKIVVAEGGDANLDGVTDAADAAAILTFAAEKGAGGDPVLMKENPRLSYFLADVNEYSTACGENDGTSLDAKDASAILQYAAIGGSGVTPDWSEIIQN